MATWQVDFALEPDMLPLPSGYGDRLDGILPRGPTWSRMQEGWGVEDGTRIDIWHDPRGATEISVRFDVRSLDPKLFEAILGFVRYTGRHLQLADGRIVASDLGELTLALRGSAAWRFVEDPETFLRRLAVGGLDDA